MYSEDSDKWLFLPELAEIYETLTTKDTLDGPVRTMVWIKYSEIIDAMYEVMEDIQRDGKPKPGVLEVVMVNWLYDVAPEKLTLNNLKAIHEFACAIGDKVNEKARFPPDDAKDYIEMALPMIASNLSEGIKENASHQSGGIKGVASHQSGGIKGVASHQSGGIKGVASHQSGGVKEVHSQQAGGTQSVSPKPSVPKKPEPKPKPKPPGSKRPHGQDED